MRDRGAGASLMIVIGRWEDRAWHARHVSVTVRAEPASATHQSSFKRAL
jgi:hypothetical protein